MKKPNANTTTATCPSDDSPICTTKPSCPSSLILTAACVNPDTNLPVNQKYTDCVTNGYKWIQSCIPATWATNSIYYEPCLCTTAPTGYSCSFSCSNSSYTGSDTSTCIKDGGISSTVCCSISDSANCCSNGSKKCNGVCCELNECCSANGCYSKCGETCCKSDQTCINDECKISCGGSYCSISGECISGQCCYGSYICEGVCCQDGAECIDGNCCLTSRKYVENSQFKCCNQDLCGGVCCPNGFPCINEQCATSSCYNFDNNEQIFCQAGQTCAFIIGVCCPNERYCGGYCCTGKQQCFFNSLCV